jgi:ATP-dependent helicase/nuclease subunit B
MVASLLLAPVGQGKTGYGLNRLITIGMEHPFARVWVLLATRRQEAAFRQRLVDAIPERDVFFNVEFFNFYELYARLLDSAGNPQKTIDATTRHHVLRRVVASVAADLRVFHTIAETEGFARVVGDFIYELKQNQVEPHAFTATAQSEKDHDLALIYDRYQAFLIRHHLADREGQGWLALSALEQKPALAADLDFLLVDGFDQFTPVQANLLASLAGRANHTLITLTHAPGRERTIGRRFAQAQARLEAAFQGKLQVQTLDDAAADDRHSEIKYLVRGIFADNQPPIALTETTLTRQEGVLLIESPTLAAEVSAVLRRVKALILRDGIAPDDVLIAIRDWSLYRGHFLAYAEQYNLPLALHYGAPLAENPAVIVLLALLQLAVNDFPRRDVLDVLRSPYLDSLSDEQIDMLDRLSHRQQVVRGRDQWRAALRESVRPQDDEAIDDALAGRAFSADDFKQLTADLDAFFDSVTPARYGTVREYVTWVDAFIGQDWLPQDPEDEIMTDDEPSGIVAQIRVPGTPPDMVARDLAALDAMRRVLQEFLLTDDLLGSLGAGNRSGALDWPTFYTDLLRAIDRTTINPRPNRFGQVLVTTVTDARGLPHNHVFVLGLSEGLFPAPLGEDPLYLDSERQALNQRGVPLLTQAERRADDGLLYELLSIAHRSLTLSRPTTQNGQLWVASHLWHAVRRTFTRPVYRIGLGQVVPASLAASPDELALAATASQPQTPADQAAIRWFQHTFPRQWAHIVFNSRLEAARLAGTAPSQYIGQLLHPPNLTTIEFELGPGRVWSASQFNEYGTCGFRFFAGRLLQLEPLEEPEAGFDVLQLGSLYHAILEATYERIRAAGWTIIPEHLDDALAILKQEAMTAFRTAPQGYGFRADALWEYEQKTIERNLSDLLRADFSTSESVIEKVFGGTTRRPYRLEAAFGLDGMPPLRLDLDGTIVQVRGMIDRIDRVDDDVILMDYKSGTAKINHQEIETGRNFQMMIYLLATEQLLAQDDAALRVRGGLFWSIKNQSNLGDLKLSDHQETLEIGRDHIRSYLARARAGDFRVRPPRIEDGKCTRYCSFYKLCRLGHTAQPATHPEG